MRRSPSLKAMRPPSEALLLAAVFLLAAPQAQTQTPPPTPTIADQKQRGAVGARTMADGKNSMTTSLGVGVQVEDAAGAVWAIESIGYNQSEDNGTCLIKE